MTHHQMRMLLLRATSLILRAIHLAAGVTLMMANEVLKRKPIGLVLVRIIDAHTKDAPTITSESSQKSDGPYLNDLGPFEVLIPQLLTAFIQFLIH